MTTALATTATKYCPGCCTHLPLKDFERSHGALDGTSTHCRSCHKRTVAERKEAVVNEAVKVVLAQIGRGEISDRHMREFAFGTLGKLGTADHIETLVSDAVRGLLLNPTSWKAQSEGIKTVERLKSALDKDRQTLADGLARLSEEQKCQLGFGLIVRAMAEEGTFELLANLVAQYGYRLVPDEPALELAPAREAAHA